MLTRVLSMKMLNAKLLHSFLLFLIALPSISIAQSFSGYNWYFGNSASGIRFSRSDNSPTLVGDKATPFGIGGSAVANDPINGNLLFYTDGLTIYDISHVAMPDGTGLGANASGNQPVAIAKVPGQDNQYYVFSNTSNFTTSGSISYRIVDMSIPGNVGAPSAPPMGNAIVTVPPNTLVPGLPGTSEAMITIGHSNGDDFWLITHENGSPNYVVTLFTPTGPTTTTTFSGLGLIEVAANFSYHPASGKIAVSPQEATRDVEILDFDPATGALTFQQRVLNSGVASTTSQAIYDTEWSHNGQYLYISQNGETGIPGDVLQYDLNNPSSTLTSILPQPISPNLLSYGLQMGPDSTIYHLYQDGPGSYFLGRISDTDSVSNLVQYSAQAFPGPPVENFDGRQFPSFAPRDTVDLNVSFIPQGLCANAPTSFFPTVTPAADSLRWNFGDNSGSSDWSPVHTYEEGGPFDVSVIAYLNGQTDTTTQTINITDFDTQITLVQDTTGCSANFPFPKDKTVVGCKATGSTAPCFTVTAQVNGGTNPDLQWFGPSGELVGQKTTTLSPDSAGYYYLVAKDLNTGCETYAGVNIKEYLVEDQRANIWYFGNQAGLDFNPLPENAVAAITNGVMNAPAGTATISDRNGQVVLFTDGETVWNRDNAVVATGIGGDKNSTQSSIIMPVPGDETLYYIFTTQAVYGTGTYEVRYSLFDLKEDVANAVVEKNVLLFAKSTERLTGNANWLIAHEYGNNSFRAYEITSNGIGNPVISAIGSEHSFTSSQNGQGYMKLGSGDKLAVALSTPGVSNVVEVFDFADSTGAVTNFRTADLNNPNGQVYGIEFSPGGNKLYTSLQDVNGPGASQIVEFAFDTLDVPQRKDPPIDVTGKIGAIQIGPDGQVYVAVDGATSLGIIQPDEDFDDVSSYTPNAGQPPFLAGTSSTLGLPNFIQTIIDPIQSPGLTFTGVCIGDSTMFSASGKDSSIDKFDWTFGDGHITLDGGPQLAHLYATPGTYTVQVTVHNNCESYPLPAQQVTINGVPPTPTPLGVDLCASPGPTELNAAYNHPEFSYLWSNGDTTETIMINRAGIYRVSITNAAGCTTDAEFDASDNRPILNLGPNITICENTPIARLDAQNPAIGNTYAWTIATNNGSPVPSGTSQTQSVDTSAPGVFEYEVTVNDGLCVAKDSVIYTINPAPTFTSIPANTLACLANNGSLDVTITGPIGPPDYLFSYFITGPTSVPSGNNQTIGSLPTFTGLAAGTYGITVADQVSGCASIDTEVINDPAFTATVAKVNSCDPLILRITPSAGAIFPINYRVIDATTAQQVASGTAPSGPFDTPGVPSGTYIVELTATGGCVFSTPAAPFAQDPPLVVSFNTTEICDGFITAEAPGATSFDWSQSPTGSLVDPTATTGRVAINPGSWLLRVTANGGAVGTCPGSGTTNVTIDNYTPAFTQSDACQDQVTLTATPAGSFTYRWFRNGVGIPGGRQITVTAADDNASYFVRVVSTLNGCIKPSLPANVQVDGELNVTLATTTPCEGSPFTLTATPNRSATFQWARDSSPISGETSATLQEDRSGRYTVTATAATCTATANIQIELAPLTPGLLRDQAYICPDPANPDPSTRFVRLSPGDFVSYDWAKDGVSLNDFNPTFDAGEPGRYTVELVNTFGCLSSDKTDVIVECDPVIVGPNAFRPTSTVQGTGGDLVNQSFKLFTFFIDDDDFQVFIFNRWGEMIFESPDRDFKWNGGYKNNLGQIAPAGTYSYVVRYRRQYRPEGIQEKRGGVVLLR